MTQAMKFQDGQRYESSMGTWSAPVGEIFLTWLNLPAGQSWLDIACGNGAFTEQIVAAAKPSAIEAIDPSEAQLDFARERHRAGLAHFAKGTALELPFADATLDAAAMALVLFFLSDPAKGVAEMRRVLKPGGTAAAYVWDIYGGGFPYEDIHLAMREIGAEPLLPPRSDVAAISVLTDPWQSAGFEAVETRQIGCRREFPTFEDYWETACAVPGIARSWRLSPKPKSPESERLSGKSVTRILSLSRVGRTP